MNKLEWKTNEYGHKDTVLFIGGLCAGAIMDMSCEMKNWPTFYAADPADDAATTKSKAFHLDLYNKLEKAPWRAWFMSSEDGDEIGYFATRDDAKSALEKKLIECLGVPAGEID